MYQVPQMPLAVHIYTNGTWPAGPPRVVTVGNLSFGRRTMTGHPADGFTVLETSFAILLLPAGTDIRDFGAPAGLFDYVEVPAGTGRIYRVVAVDDFGKGFPNEHRFATIHKQAPWPIPIP